MMEMDNRFVLEEGTGLSFPGMDCRIDSFLGKGANSMVYMGSYPDRQFPENRHRILIKELFPFHPQGQIFRSPGGDICWTEDAEPVMELHRLSFERGNKIHIQLLGEHPENVEANINTFSLHDTLYTVLGFSGGRSLEKELDNRKTSNIPLIVHVQRMTGILDALEAFHHSGFLHLDISPDNILLIGDGRKERISLIDYNSVHTLEEIRRGESVYYSVKEGFTAPEIRLGKIGEIGYASDLYSLTAVFYWMLSGRKLSVWQTVSGQVPDVTDVPCLAAMPDTVCSMVRKILKHGVASLAGKRYQSAVQMRQDLLELHDRIEGKGITHPVLWETGRANILRAISSNPALGYIKEDEKLYPVMGETSQGEVITLDRMIKEMMAPEGCSILLLGNGGAGKTTALMRAAYLQPSRYSGMEPAFTYLSLYGWSENKTSYIKDRILENLKFKPGTESIEMARHELIQMLSSPMHTRLGERPWLVILLDGLNEVSGDTKELLREITELSQMEGVRILLTSRSDTEETAFRKINLRPLEKAEVRKILGENGVLMPEQEKLAELLRSPMMLSIYIRTVWNQGKQLLIQSQEQLLDSFFEAILGKEIRDLPENSGERWQIEAALYYVLPEIARLMKVKGRALSDQDMLPALRKCYRRMKKRRMLRVFPQWIGHIADIRGEAVEEEAWYGLMVHRILWRRLGLVVRDEQGKYRTFHQLAEEYMIEVQRNFDRKFLRYERGKAVFVVVLSIFFTAGIYEWVYLPYRTAVQEEKEREVEKTHYDRNASENVLDSAFAAYKAGADQYGYFRELMDCLPVGNGAADELEYDAAVIRCRDILEEGSMVGILKAEDYLADLYEFGEVMPWSGQPFPEDVFRELIVLPEERAQEYMDYLEILVWAAEEEGAWELYDGEDFVGRLEDFLEADARILGKYFNEIIAPELTAMEQSNSQGEQQKYVLYMIDYALTARQNEITQKADGDMESYKEERRTALEQLQNSEMMKAFGISKVESGKENGYE